MQEISGLRWGRTRVERYRDADGEPGEGPDEPDDEGGANETNQASLSSGTWQ
jgi:hypothetical protein